jgi:sulfur carrier protein ThiS adenylyltransferase
MKIGIAGVGGIGSNVALHLVRSGLVHLKIIDSDCVEASNLNRQFYFHDQIGRPKVAMLAANLKRISPQAEIEPRVMRLTVQNIAAVFADCGIVVEGFDDQEEKKWLLETLAAAGKPVVAACGVAGRELARLAVHRIGCCQVAGDFVTDCRSARLYSHKVSAVAALMADRVLHEAGCYDES